MFAKSFKTLQPSGDYLSYSVDPLVKELTEAMARLCISEDTFSTAETPMNIDAESIRVQQTLPVRISLKSKKKMDLYVGNPSPRCSRDTNRRSTRIHQVLIKKPKLFPTLVKAQKKRGAQESKDVYMRSPSPPRTPRGINREFTKVRWTFTQDAPEILDVHMRSPPRCSRDTFGDFITMWQTQAPKKVGDQQKYSCKRKREDDVPSVAIRKHLVGFNLDHKRPRLEDGRLSVTERNSVEAKGKEDSCVRSFSAGYSSSAEAETLRVQDNLLLHNPLEAQQKVNDPSRIPSPPSYPCFTDGVANIWWTTIVEAPKKVGDQQNLLLHNPRKAQHTSNNPFRIPSLPIYPRCTDGESTTIREDVMEYDKIWWTTVVVAPKSNKLETQQMSCKGKCDTVSMRSFYDEGEATGPKPAALQCYFTQDVLT